MTQHCSGAVHIVPLLHGCQRCSCRAAAGRSRSPTWDLLLKTDMHPSSISTFLPPPSRLFLLRGSGCLGVSLLLSKGKDTPHRATVIVHNIPQCPNHTRLSQKPDLHGMLRMNWCKIPNQRHKRTIHSCCYAFYSCSLFVLLMKCWFILWSYNYMWIFIYHRSFISLVPSLGFIILDNRRIHTISSQDEIRPLNYAKLVQ